MLASLFETRYTAWALPILRAVFGAAFVAHGWGKVLDPAGHAQFAAMLGGLGVPEPGFFAWLSGLTEFLGGILLVVGLLTRPVALAALINMAVALALVHWSNGFLSTNQPPGWELNALYMAAFATLLVAGAGHLSLDEAIARALRRRGEARVATGRAPMRGAHPIEGT